MVINPSCSYLDSSGNISLDILKNWTQVQPAELGQISLEAHSTRLSMTFCSPFFYFLNQHFGWYYNYWNYKKREKEVKRVKNAFNNKYFF